MNALPKGHELTSKAIYAALKQFEKSYNTFFCKTDKII